MARGIRTIDRQRAARDRLIARHGNPKRKPVDLPHRRHRRHLRGHPAGAGRRPRGRRHHRGDPLDGQSLLDFVPEGATREGYAGTYATQENFRLMRAALDETSKELGRYVRLTNYASGLCMPEIATLAGLERLDMMLNDSMYGILFRDINPIRTFVDQRFSRQVHARAGIIINTGEDNYLTTADAVDAAHTVTVSQLLNEYFAKEAGLEDWQLGLGHAFEIDPDGPRQLPPRARARPAGPDQLFPEAPLKWMPPTKHMTGDVFRGYLLDGFFNLAGTMTGQGILLVGMMTEAVVTPWISDRDLALQNVRYVMDAAGGLTEDFHPPRDGFIQTRARQVLGEAVDLLDTIVTDTSTQGSPRSAPSPTAPSGDEAAPDQGQGSGRRRPQGRRLPQPGHRPALETGETR
jgi:beta-lysine 5,6-aminomutase alpha subunit